MVRLAIGAVAGYTLMEWCGALLGFVSALIGALLAQIVIEHKAETLTSSRGPQAK